MTKLNLSADKCLCISGTSVCLKVCDLTKVGFCVLCYDVGALKFNIATT